MNESVTPSVAQTAGLIGTWRRFGSAGPVYEIVGPGAPLAVGDPCLRIRVVETGEEADYRLRDILEDPAAE